MCAQVILGKEKEKKQGRNATNMNTMHNDHGAVDLYPFIMRSRLFLITAAEFDAATLFFKVLLLERSSPVSRG